MAPKTAAKTKETQEESEAPMRVKRPTRKRGSAKKKEPEAVETSKTIADQVEAFLAKGGNIQNIDMGVSGQQNVSGPKHITLGNKSNKS